MSYLLSRISIVISIGLDSSKEFLACIGLGGFLARLLAWMMMPIILGFVVVLGWLVRLKCVGTLSCRNLLESVTPLLLRLSFLLYPTLTNIAFEGFSCFEFDNRTSAFLVSDVSIACSTPLAGPSAAHERVMRLAYVAIVVYPVGLLLLYGACCAGLLAHVSAPPPRLPSSTLVPNSVTDDTHSPRTTPHGVHRPPGALLHASKDAILSGRPTALSGALSFLHREYRPAYWWWYEQDFDPHRLRKEWERQEGRGVDSLIWQGANGDGAAGSARAYTGSKPAPSRFSCLQTLMN